MAELNGVYETIVVPYKARPIWQNELHPALEQYRFSVIVAHRRFGKTRGCLGHVLKMALRNTKLHAPRYAYVAPLLKQAKMIAWAELKRLVKKIPGIKINESELWVELPSNFADSDGARIYIIGADRPDTLRGTYWDGIIIDEYADIKKELWGEVMLPALTDRHGWAVFIGTPKGQNHFYDIYLLAQKDPAWFCALYTVDDSKVLSDEDIELMKKNMTETERRQELYCDFTASAYNRLITIDIINQAMDKEGYYKPNDYADAPKIMGVDVARFGEDSCVIFKRQGLQAFEPKIYNDIDNMTFAGIISDEIRKWGPDTVFIDSGRGEGVIDRLRQVGFDDKVVEVNFGGTAMRNTRYFNKRAEMWDTARDWLVSGGALPYNPELRSELAAPEYTFDSQNRIKLQSKEAIKEKTGSSPDIADAFCLTFAFPVMVGRRKLYMQAKRSGKLKHYGAM